MSFATIHTQAGLQAMSEAEAAGVPINLTHIAVGDGNGAPVTPTEDQTALVREMYRSAVNRVFKPDPVGQPTKFAVELVVPATEGGFVLREVGVFDADGTLFVVGNLPETYKPQASEGSYSDTVVRVEFIATNADIVTLQLDPNVAVASQAWVTNNITAGALIPGGTTGQVLTKQSNADGDVVWQDATDANVIVQTVEESQVLADGQTTVTLTTCSTVGLAVYIDGLRIAQGTAADEWEPDPVDPAVFTLGQSYPAGTELFAVQNEPAAGFPDALLRDSNLADVPDKPLARQNLGVYSRAQTDQKAPPGMIAYFARSTAPAGWLKANGAELNRTTYSALFNAIGTAFGAGNGVDTFNLPDLRGEFLRGWDDGRTVDGGREFASAQGDAIRNITGSFQGSDDRPLGYQSGAFRVVGVLGSSDGGAGTGKIYDFSAARVVPTAPENRPRNIALLACIKF